MKPTPTCIPAPEPLEPDDQALDEPIADLHAVTDSLQEQAKMQNLFEKRYSAQATDGWFQSYLGHVFHQ